MIYSTAWARFSISLQERTGAAKARYQRCYCRRRGSCSSIPMISLARCRPRIPQALELKRGRAALARMNDLLSSCRSFAVESTLSGRAHLSLIARARALGYCIILIYSFVDSVDACIARIAMRVQAGGHFVPDEDVRRRYLRSKRNFLNVYSPVADEWMLYYNGDSVPVLVAHGGRLDETHVVSPRLMDRFKEDLCPVM